MIHLYGRHTSFNVQKVLWTLAELGVEYEHTNLGGAYGGLDTAEFGEMNPNRRIPVLVDGDLTLWESNTIVRYLATEYGQGSLWPLDRTRRSHADQWMEWAVNNLLPAFAGLLWGYYRTPEPQRDNAAIAQTQRRADRLYALLDDHLSGQAFLAGDSLTAGDIPAGTSLYRYFEMGLDVSKPPNLMAWYERLLTRKAYRDHVAEPFDELFGRLDF
ncbi:MAG: glutathione S-transferase family protein [Gammaproteobacteria bacterium]|nr:glutathione S-transferase family protein [Gammaproteobacteria bacterium]MCZ6852680.1 glutathione S-transferase family protein [Gammaproteobacteria bacterium]